jgi:glycosyltransferase involved in cell wall biosynthesis
MKKITIITPCYNEELNILEMYHAVKAECAKIKHIHFEHLFIDNSSEDKTVELIKSVIATDPKVKLIVNQRNFGHIRSPYHALMQADGDACIFMVADLQDPPSLISDFIAQWETCFPIVIGVKTQSKESPLLFFIRTTYYKLLRKFGETELVKNYTGFGLYDRKVIEQLRQIEDPYPYFRGLVLEFGFPFKTIEYTQPTRYRGISKNNFYTLFDIAMLGFTSHSLIPLRIASIIGFSMSIVSACIAIFYFFYKIFYWNELVLGFAPLLIGLFFILSVILFFIGILGEYIINLTRFIKKRPHVIEKERIGF